jgi:ferric-dicitrate binding protein FerR (iron transport regulator)
LQRRWRRRRGRPFSFLAWASIVSITVFGITTLSIAIGWAAGRAFIGGKVASSASSSAKSVSATNDLAELRDGAVLGDQSAPARLVFSDGSQLTLPARARARVDALGAEGARIAILDGAVEASLAATPSGDWRFSAGPFSILVKGTAFMIDWSPSREHLVVRTHAGALQIAGPLVPEPTLITSGQTMTVALRDRRVIIDRGRAETSSDGRL